MNEANAFDDIVSRPDYYIEFLDERRGLDDERYVKELVVKLLDLRPGQTVLDLGSGAGSDTCQLAELVAPGGKAVGVDHSAEMVAEGRRRAEEAKVPAEFVQGDALALEFPDASFDRCRTERMLIHLDDPAAAVREMVRVTKPEGLVVASDIDGGTIFVNSSNRELTTKLQLGIADSLASGWTGRRLQRYLMDAGLADVRCATTVIQNSVGFMRMVFTPKLGQLVEAGEASAEEVDEFWAELEDGEQAGWLSSGIVCFTVVGRKP